MTLAPYVIQAGEDASTWFRNLEGSPAIEVGYLGDQQTLPHTGANAEELRKLLVACGGI